jgi:GT2 family glycosyltransferase
MEASAGRPRFSVIVPTHQRRERVVHNVEALAKQELASFEVVVVDDGGSDGTATALRELNPPFPLTVLEQENSGAAEARNAGTRAAGGEILLFLDDDMEADPAMLAEHDRCHREGADLVVGDMPLHPDSPQNLLSVGVGLWASSRRERLTTDGGKIGPDDLLTGQMSISREAFDRVGGFDTSFTREGLFGGEDIDFGLRVVKAGFSVVYNPAAISYQYYDVDPGAYLRRTREAGRSEEELVLKARPSTPAAAAGSSARWSWRRKPSAGPCAPPQSRWSGAAGRRAGCDSSSSGCGRRSTCAACARRGAPSPAETASPSSPTTRFRISATTPSSPSTASQRSGWPSS